MLSYPNSSFVDISVFETGPYNISVTVVLPNYHCVPPAPFYGTYCWKDNWYSEGVIQVFTADLVGSSGTDTVHHGSLVIEDQITVVNSSLHITDNLIISNSSYGVFQVSNSTVSSGQLTFATGSTIVITLTGNTSISSGSVNIQGGTLRIILTPEQEEELKKYGTLSLSTINSENIQGQFDNVEFTVANSSACNLQASQEVQNNQLVAILNYSPVCGNADDELLAERFTAATIGIVIAVIIILIALSIYLYYKRRRVYDYVRKLAHGAGREPSIEA